MQCHVVICIVATNCLCLCLQGKDGAISQSAMTCVHAGLQDGVKVACEKAGAPVYKLAEQPDYKLLYQLYCTKSVARSDNNSDNVHLSMTADDLTRMCHQLLASDSREHMRDLAMILYQFATVSRGDDVRPRSLSELMVRYLKAVGEYTGQQ